MQDIATWQLSINLSSIYAVPCLQLKHQLCPKQKQLLQPRQQRAAVRTPVMIQTRRKRRSQQRLAFLSSSYLMHVWQWWIIGNLTNRIAWDIGLASPELWSAHAAADTMQKNISVVQFELVPGRINFFSCTFVSYPNLVLAFILGLPGLTSFAKKDWGL